MGNLQEIHFNNFLLIQKPCVLAQTLYSPAFAQNDAIMANYKK
jgi:hypothetical protein